jgi:hypothetical protein
MEWSGHKTTCSFCFVAGMNGDCSTVFVNNDVNPLGSINGLFYVEFITIGPAEGTECRITENGVNGVFVPCKYCVLGWPVVAEPG